MLGVSGLLCALPPAQPEALPVVLVLAVTGWVAYRREWLVRFWPWLVLVSVPLAVPWTGAERSPLLPALLCGGLTLGLAASPRVMLGGAVLALSLLLGEAALLDGSDIGSRRDLAAASAQWVALSVAVGAVAVWGRLLAVPPAPPDPYAEVGALLEQLRRSSQRLPSGLDAGAAATSLLERMAREVPHQRSAVVVRPNGGSFVPLAVKGATRVPWRDSLDQPGPMRQAMETGLPVLDRRKPDIEGRRQGNALLAVPLLAGSTPFGLVVLESPEATGFTDDELAVVGRLAAEAASHLETALLFEEVRQATSTEERDRLAREMHDGIAQELAFLGYRLDELRGRATPLDESVGKLAADVRSDLTRLMSDLRLSITSMRTSIRSDRGLGQTLGSYLQAVCTGKGIELNLTLKESAFRLPADQEVALLAAAQAFAQGVRRSSEVTVLTVTLHVDPPSALLKLECDAPLGRINLGETASVLENMGASVRISDEASARGRLVLMILGGSES